MHATAVAELRPEQRFHSVLGSRRGAPRSYDAFLAGRPRTLASTEAAELIKGLRAGRTAEVVSVLARASGRVNSFVEGVASVLAETYAERGPGRWQHTADTAFRAFGLETLKSGVAQLDKEGMASWEAECYEGLQAKLESRLRAGEPITEAWLQNKADEACRAGLVWGLAGTCKRASSRMPRTYLEGLLGEELENLRIFWEENKPRSVKELQAPAKALADAFGVVDWAEVTESWVSLTRLSGVSDIAAREETARSRVDLASNLADALMAAVLRGHPQD